MISIVNKVLAFKLGALRLDNPPTSNGDTYTKILSDKISTGITVASEVAVLLCFIAIVISGLRYMTSAGNAESAKRGLKGMLYAVLGIIIISLSWIGLAAILDLLSK